ncbi:MAG TPA: SRPBCC domain-containing protein [Propionicimonas sp.]|jgi:uncharacterized protein YndB with AHSA1/START domain
MTISTNQPAAIDEGTFSVHRSIRIAAAVGKVWEAVTVPEHISRWFGHMQLAGQGAGATGTISWPGRDAIPLLVEAIDPERMVAYRWNNDDASGTFPDAFEAGTSTVFTFTLEPVEGGTQLTVVETGFEVTSDPAENLSRHQQGWTSELDKLAALLEARP